jgi:hypothetical protein
MEMISLKGKAGNSAYPNILPNGKEMKHFKLRQSK